MISNASRRKDWRFLAVALVEVVELARPMKRHLHSEFSVFDGCGGGGGREAMEVVVGAVV
jgi:hypothetical protein